MAVARLAASAHRPRPLSSSGPYANARRVELDARHIEGSRIVHLTVRSFLAEALCGEPVQRNGEPDIALICEDCDRLGREAGGDPAEWVVGATVRIELRAAA